MATQGQKAKQVAKRDRAKLKAAKHAVKMGVQGSGPRLAHHEAKALGKVTLSGVGGMRPRL